MATLEKLCGAFFENKINKNQSDIDCFNRVLSKFCKSGKKEDAFSVYYCFCEIFEVFGSGYGSMNRLLEFLADHEFHSGELLIKHRDHYSHSVYVFALGLAIYANDKSFRKSFLQFYKKESAGDTEFLLWWGLAALFHDIGYPFQLAHEQIKSYAQSVWGEGSSVSPFVAYENMEGLLTVPQNVKTQSPAFTAQTVGEMLAYGIHKRLGYPVNVLLDLLTERYCHQKSFMDHGYFSAVLLFNQLAKANASFSEPVADVLTAIALHNNLNRYDIAGKIDTNFAIPVDKHPLAYLLVLCDELQDWDRTAFGLVSKKDPLAWKVELFVAQNKIDMTYVFDSFYVIETKEDVRQGKGVICESNRENCNYKKIASGKFAADIQKLIDGKINLTATAREEKKNKKVTSFASSDNFLNLCDFAYAIHKGYQSVYGGPDFENCSLEVRLSNIEQAKSYSDKLELINCFYSGKELDYPVVNGFTDGLDDLSFLAREEHLRWVREKLNAGWKYGKDYKTKEERDAKRIHKDIVPFDFLSDEDKSKDELMIKNMVPFLYHYGHGVRIYRCRGAVKPVLNIACCGSHTVGMEDARLKERIKEVLTEYQKNYRVVLRTNFALGADLLIAECANELGITVKAALPLPYEEYISSVRANAEECDEFRMRHLLALTVSCKVIPDSENSSLQAWNYIVNKSNKLIVLCGGEPDLNGEIQRKISVAKNSHGLSDSDVHIIKC